jgi:heme-degrading monooxygenase HmoA
MAFVSLTRLRLRSLRFLPGFGLYATRSLDQIRKAPGFLAGQLLPDRDWTYWTMTAWDGMENMRRYMTSGAHQKAMPRLMEWCDEASVAHWEQADAVLPGWEEADRRMRAIGRASKVRFPSERHAGLRYREPRSSGGVGI